MSNKKNHNTVYFLTTLSVYLGLLVVGASPQVLAQAKLSQNSSSHSFEARTNTNNAFSELKFKTQFELDEVLPFASAGNSTFSNRIWTLAAKVQSSTDLHTEVLTGNNQVFTVSILPRASI
jgi:hypothetical protein